MKNEKMYDAVTDIRDDLVERADRHRFAQQTSRRRWTAALAAVLALVLVAGALLLPGGHSVVTARAIAAPDYPETAPYPVMEDFTDAEGNVDQRGYMNAVMSWADARQTVTPDLSGLQAFTAASASAFFGDTDGTNVSYSPVNVYLALGMLSEVTGGSSRAQILDALGADSVESLRAQAHNLWNACYRDDGAVSSILASSLWLSDAIDYNDDTLRALADHYYAASFTGTMGSDEYNALMTDWVREQTGGLLDAPARLDPQTVLALATTVQFRARWAEPFLPEDTAPAVFHGSRGDSEVPFLHCSEVGPYFEGSAFGAVRQDLNNGAMYFLLPQEGTSPEQLLQDPEVAEFLFAGDRWPHTTGAILNKSIPKFDLSSELSLTDGLRALGITDVFDPARADCSPMAENADGVFLSGAEHNVRVAIDEEGVSAAAVTTLTMAGAGFTDQVVDFVLDRPFVFAITNEAGLPLFLGVVNQIP